MSDSAAVAPQASAGGLTRWRVLVGAIVIQLILGTVYGYSIFWKPLESALYPAPASAVAVTQSATPVSSPSPSEDAAAKKAKKKLSDERQAPLKLAFGLCILSFAITMVFAGRIQDAKGPQKPAMIGGALLGASFLVAGQLGSILPGGLSANIESAKWAIWLTIGMLAGAGIGFAYVCPLAALVKWFPKQKGLVSGIAVAGFGFGAFIFSHPTLPFGGTLFIQQHGILSFFTTHGIVALIAVSAGAFMLCNPPGTQLRTSAAEKSDLLKQPAFYMLWPMFFSGALAGLTVIGVMKGFAGDQLVAAAGTSDPAKIEALQKAGAAAVGFLAIFNAVGRVVWGMVSDRIGRTGAFIAMFSLQAVMMFLLPGLKTEMAIAVGACTVGFNFGGNFALFPSATADLFGAKTLGANYAMVFTSYGIAGYVGITSGNLAKEATGNYNMAFIAAGVLCVLSAVLALALHFRSKKPALAQ